MTYRTNDRYYSFSYQEIKDQYHIIVNYSDDEFMNALPEILHFACFVSYLKELGIEATVGDQGIIHQLVHLLHIGDEPLIDLAEIREQFNHLMKIA